MNTYYEDLNPFDDVLHTNAGIRFDYLPATVRYNLPDVPKGYNKTTYTSLEKQVLPRTGFATAKDVSGNMYKMKTPIVRDPTAMRLAQIVPVNGNVMRVVASSRAPDPVMKPDGKLEEILALARDMQAERNEHAAAVQIMGNVQRPVAVQRINQARGNVLNNVN